VLGLPQLGGVNSRLRLAEAQQWKVLLVTVVPQPSMSIRPPLTLTTA